jgi:hypothetical protein
MESKYHPEIDDLPLLQEFGTLDYQKIHGTCQCLNLLCYAISLVSQISAAPQQGHLQHAHQEMGVFVFDLMPTSSLRICWIR